MSEARTILVATDFSAQARHALERAAWIAHDTAAALTLLHVLPGPALEQIRAWLGVGTAVEAGLEDEAQEHLRRLVQRVQATRPLSIDPVVTEGPVLDTVLREAERTDARLIALGGRGVGLMRQMTLGSTCERLMRKSTRPLLVVRQTPHEGYGRVLVAVDFSEWSLGALELVRWVAPRARLLLTTVFQVPFASRLRLGGVTEAMMERYREQARAQALEQLDALAARAGLPADCWEPCVAEGSPALKLLELEQEHDCDLVAVGKHGTSRAVDFLLGSVTQALLAEGTSDLLISTQLAS